MLRLFKSLFTKKPSSVPVYLKNTLSEKKELFVARTKGVVTLYSCGPTVYNRATVGNLRSYLFSDTLARMLRGAGYAVKRVINITDVGHMVGDGDEGEDKMNVGAKREQLSPKTIADRYTNLFKKDIADLNIDTTTITFPRATEYINEQIEMIEVLEKKGLAYPTSDGVYFDTQKFPNYGVLGNIKNVEQQEGIRVSVNEEKRNPHDFALWRKAKKDDLQQWNSPWGKGNPGWSIECSAMSRAILGDQIDIHTGGIDHIPVHHNNEIAQSEGVTGKKFVNYWMHNAFISINNAKISKSLGNTYALSDIIEKGFHPLSLRYLYLQAHYSSPLSFTWESIEAAHEALIRLWRASVYMKGVSKGKGVEGSSTRVFIALIQDDLATPQALAHLWTTLESEDVSPAEKWELLKVADALLGLSLLTPPQEFLPKSYDELPQEVQMLVDEREQARQAKDYAKADELRIHIENRGYRVEDGAKETLFTPIHK